MTRHPLPVACALDWFLASGERTVERLNDLIDDRCQQLAFPVTDEHRAAAVESCRHLLESNSRGR